MSRNRVYGIQSGEFIKVGITHDLKRRKHEMALFNPHPCKVVFNKYAAVPRFIERELHKALAQFAIGREWFKITPEQLFDAYKQVSAAYTKKVREQYLWELEWERRRESRSGVQSGEKHPSHEKA